MVLPLVLSLAALAAPEAAASTDPLAAARDGMMQCTAPDAARRTCKSLSSYAFGPDGVLNRAEAVISPNMPLVMRIATPVTVRGSAVCGPIRAEDIESSQIVFAGRPITGEQAEKAKAQLKGSLGGLIGAEICTTFQAAQQGYTTQVSVNGAPAPDMSGAPVIWVKPGEGWKVAP